MRCQRWAGAEHVYQPRVDPAQRLVEDDVCIREHFGVEEGGLIRGGEEAVAVAVCGTVKECGLESGKGRFGVRVQGRCVEEAAAGGGQDFCLGGGADLV